MDYCPHTGKIAHKDRKLAVAQAASLNIRSKSGRQHTYRCPHCGHWHTGRQQFQKLQRNMELHR